MDKQAGGAARSASTKESFMILTDEGIVEAVKDGAIRISPYSPDQLQPASYDLRVGSEGITTRSEHTIDIEEKGLLILSPGDFGIVVTREEIELDLKHTARIGLRSKYARKGIIATAGPQIDPGYRGRLKIGLTNLSPHTVTFPFEDDLVTIELHSLTREARKGYSGPYQGDVKLSAEDISAVTEGESMGFSTVMDTLRTLSRNVGELAAQVEQLQEQFKLFQERFELFQKRFDERNEQFQRQFEQTQKQFEGRTEQIQKRFDERNEQFQKQFDERNERFERQFEQTQKQFEDRTEQIQKRFDERNRTDSEAV